MMQPTSEAGAVPLTSLSPGSRARVAHLGERIDAVQRERLLAYGVSPGAVLTLLRQRPMTVVLADEVELALESAVARQIRVQPC